MKSSIKKQDRRTDWIERLAVTASFACLFHCLGLPILFAVLPAMSRALALPETFHLWMIVIVLPASSAALFAGKRRHHAVRPLLLGFIGLTLLLVGALPFGETEFETPITVGGSLILAWAHIMNWRLRHMGQNLRHS